MATAVRVAAFDAMLVFAGVAFVGHLLQFSDDDDFPTLDRSTSAVAGVAVCSVTVDRIA